MRTRTVLLGLALACLFSLEGVEVWADDTHDHSPSEEGSITLADLSPEQRVRARRLYQLIMCDCPKEDYTRTLSNCPDACADPQKRIINAMVLESQSDEAVKQLMLSRVGNDQRVLASPETGFGLFGGFLPFLILAMGVVFAGMVLRSWQRHGRDERQVREKNASSLSDEELARVDRELAEID